MVFLRGPAAGRAPLWITYMATYAEQLYLVKDLPINEGETRRIDCPFCRGRYTFTLTNEAGSVIWNCYKASCGSHGAKKVGYSGQGIRNRLSGIKTSSGNKTVRPVPELLCDPSNHPKVMDYIESNNCSYAYKASPESIRYDPVSDRVLFMMNSGTGAVGRSLKGAKPKWLSFGDSSGLFISGKLDTAVVVEDAASACSVSATGVYTGVALLGTNISRTQLRQLKSFTNVIIILDRDASRKAIRLRHELDQISHTTAATVRFTNEDLKHCTVDEILHIVRGENNHEK